MIPCAWTWIWQWILISLFLSDHVVIYIVPYKLTDGASHIFVTSCAISPQFILYLCLCDAQSDGLMSRETRNLVTSSSTKSVTWFDNVLIEEEKEACRTVEVIVNEDFPLSDDIIFNHFESSRNGGGKVDDVRIHEEERVIHVIFEKAEGWCS